MDCLQRKNEQKVIYIYFKGKLQTEQVFGNLGIRDMKYNISRSRKLEIFISYFALCSRKRKTYVKAPLSTFIINNVCP